MKGYIMEHKYDLFKGKGTNDFSNITYSVLEKDWYKKEFDKKAMPQAFGVCI